MLSTEDSQSRITVSAYFSPLIGILKHKFHKVVLFMFFTNTFFPAIY